MPQFLDNPPTVTWSHSDSMADFYELPTDGQEMYEALAWLLVHYPSVKLWMGVERDDGTELLLAARPSKKADVVERLQVFEEESVF